MAATPTDAGAPAGGAAPNHGRRILMLWIIASVICVPLVSFVLGPHLPPGDMSSSAGGQQIDITVLAAIATPVILGVWIYFGYALTVWRQKEGDEEDGPPIHGHARIQVGWITATAVIVLALAVFGTVELIAPAGAGAGEGPQAIWKPNSKPLQVQVIAQQWRFTYRYPSFGGFETTQLVLPVGQAVQFNVTSIDVIHSFWAYQLGVKADANPGVNNIAYTTATATGGFTVRCDELCGIWHGAMYDYGKVMTVANFQSWAQQTETAEAATTKILPPYALVYDPTVIPQLGAIYPKNQITGSPGYFYPSTDPVQP